MNIKDMIKGSFMARPCMKMYNYSKNILVGIEWLWTRFFLALPSKHIRLVFLNCHKGVHIHRSVPIYRGFSWRHGGGELVIGKGSSVGINNMFDSRMGIFIGENVCFSDRVTIWTLQHDYNDIKFSTKGGPVKIGDFVWAGCNVIILPGVAIGKGAVLASGCVVTKNVEPYTVVGGVPARKIAERKRLDYDYCPADFYVHFD